MLDGQRYQTRYKEGYYVIVDTHDGDKIVPPPFGHYKRHKDGYLWLNAAQHMARQYESDRLKAAKWT